MPTCVPLSRHRQSSDPPTKPDLHLELLRGPSYKTRILFYIYLILVIAYVPLPFPDSDAPGGWTARVVTGWCRCIHSLLNYR
ncbi:hypothetical protein BGY98DRAFT_1008482 [Russula aff. rugulosa BPL654]|nr:hypothetical protein BGY98DRAFT_1008482 [Russula aff. rugulosa BPL654]